MSDVAAKPCVTDPRLGGVRTASLFIHSPLAVWSSLQWHEKRERKFG
jgi:hypothetical protein